MVEVGQSRVGVGRAVAGGVAARMETGDAADFEPQLKRKCDVAEAASCAVAAVDHHHGQRPEMVLAIGLVERAGASVRL
jgi:hypothetical protein